jgi:ketosteroid isomerase-like protein
MRAALRSDAYQVIEAGDIALYISRWRLDGTSPDGQPVSMAGESSDVLRRQRDGRWLIALDNPWGADLLPK